MIADLPRFLPSISSLSGAQRYLRDDTDFFDLIDPAAGLDHREAAILDLECSAIKVRIPR